MGTVVESDEVLTSAPDERSRAYLTLESFEPLDERHPHPPALVAQQDLRGTESQLLKEFDLFRSEFKTQLELLRSELITELKRNRNIVLMWLIPLMFAQVGAMAALVKLL